MKNALKNISVPCSYIGAALLYFWSFLIGEIEIQGDTDTSTVLSFAIPLLFALGWRRISKRSIDSWIPVSIAIVGFAGTILLIASESTQSMVQLGWAFRAFAHTSLLLLWCEFYARIPASKAAVAFASMQLASFLLFLFASVIPKETYEGMAVLMPLLSVAMLSAAKKDAASRFEPAKPIAESKAAIGKGIRWEFLFTAFICAFAYGLNQAFTNIPSNIASYGISGGIVLLGIIVLRGRFSLHLALNVAFPLIIAGMIALAVFGLSAPDFSSVFLSSGYALATAVFTILVADKSYRFGVPAIWAAGMMRFSLLAGVFCGKNAETFMESIPALEGHSIQLILIATIVLIAIAVYAWRRNGGDEREKIKIAMHGAMEPEKNEPVVQNVISLRNEIESRCASISKEYCLSARESEILVFLALGWSAPRIEKELTVSNSTVKTHIRHIYSKLGIHSRDELKILVGVDTL